MRFPSPSRVPRHSDRPSPTYPGAIIALSPARQCGQLATQGVGDPVGEIAVRPIYEVVEWQHGDANWTAGRSVVTVGAPREQESGTDADPQPEECQMRTAPYWMRHWRPATATPGTGRSPAPEGITPRLDRAPNSWPPSSKTARGPTRRLIAARRA